MKTKAACHRKYNVNFLKFLKITWHRVIKHTSSVFKIKTARFVDGFFIINGNLLTIHSSQKNTTTISKSNKTVFDTVHT